MQPTDILVRSRLVDRRPVLFVTIVGAATVACALTLPCPLPLRVAAVLIPTAIVAAALVASRETNVVLRRGPLLYMRDGRSHRLVPAPRGARMVCASTHDPNLLLLDEQGRTLAAASVRCPPEQLRDRLEPAGIAVEVW